MISTPKKLQFKTILLISSLSLFLVSACNDGSNDSNNVTNHNTKGGSGGGAGGSGGGTGGGNGGGTTQKNVSIKTTTTGDNFSLALSSDGLVWAWGKNNEGQLGDGTTISRVAPVKLNLSGVKAIAGGSMHSLALLNDGTVLAWGQNTAGELGNGTIISSSNPVKVLNLSGVKAIEAGEKYSVAVLNDGTVRAWGYNLNGQLGDGTVTNQTTPVKVKQLSNVQSIAAYGLVPTHFLALHNDGTVSAWGYNRVGQLGNGSKKDSLTPIKVLNVRGVQAIAAGDQYSMALMNDGTVFAWGLNRNGKLGVGSQSPTISRPMQVANLSNVKAIALGANHALARHADGSVSAWGDNYNSELGDGTRSVRNTAQKVKNLNKVQAIAAGKNHSVAVFIECGSQNAVWAWGKNSSGQLGTNSNITSPIPSKVSVFKTSCTENTAPRVANTSPRTALTLVSNMPMRTKLTALFNEPMQAASINAASFVVEGGNVAGTVTYANATRIATFIPTSRLSPNQTYTASITTAATDMVGNALNLKKDWSFTATTYVTAAAVTMNEGNSGKTRFIFTLTMDTASPTDVTMSYYTSNGVTAGNKFAASLRDKDYVKKGKILGPFSTITIPAGSTRATVSVMVNGDTKPEPDEYFLLNFFRLSSNATFIQAGTSVSTLRVAGNIRNDD